MSKNRIGIFGGTFNPPHIGHIAAARQVVAALDLGKLLMIPTNIPPHKQLPEGSASPEQRLEMVGIAASMIPMAEACDIEIRREGASYTADTVAALKEIYPEATLWLMIGTDMIDTFDRWYCPEKIVAHCRLAAVARGDDDLAVIEQKAEELRRKLGAEIDIIYNDVVEGSSTEFRNGNERLVPSEIRRYIRKQGLYGLE
ncbi:MAG: nicotinate (nicotinamide) nucleotide adenylyltransferase [Clostridia bacterium]|nr:nicotinate (nicotinamide) nucleotide adenylyltransferase [Clostridia bacterium]